MKTKKEKIISLIISVIALVGALIIHLANQPEQVPAFSGMAYVALNNNQPEFKESELVTRAYEYYSPLDPLGRCGYAMACVGTEIMPTEERGSIGQVKPSGWQMAKYDHVDGKYLYNRCHLIGYQLTGENANEQNLITGTRYLNIEGMLPFENMVADFVKETGYHVIYRVTPIFHGDELVARGVQLEGFSHPEKHCQRLSCKGTEKLTHSFRCRTDKFTFYHFEKVCNHPSADCCIKHHKEIVARNSKITEYMPFGAFGFKLVK